jgi:hypothetical protein
MYVFIFNLNNKNIFYFKNKQNLKLLTKGFLISFLTVFFYSQDQKIIGLLNKDFFGFFVVLIKY